MKVLVIEPNGKKRIIELSEKEDQTTLSIRNRVASCNFYYISDNVFNQTCGDENMIFCLFDTLSKERRKMFFLSC